MKLTTISHIVLFSFFASNFITAHAITDRIKPYGLRRTFEHGLGDRYYSGTPAYAYQHMWPEWKRETWYTIGDWKTEKSPDWITYYDYPYAVWPNFYRYFGSPYYTRARQEKRRLSKIPPKKAYSLTEDSASF